MDKRKYDKNKYNTNLVVLNAFKVTKLPIVHKIKLDYWETTALVALSMSNLQREDEYENLFTAFVTKRSCMDVIHALCNGMPKYKTRLNNAIDSLIAKGIIIEHKHNDMVQFEQVLSKYNEEEAEDIFGLLPEDNQQDTKTTFITLLKEDIYKIIFSNNTPSEKAKMIATYYAISFRIRRVNITDNLSNYKSLINFESDKKTRIRMELLGIGQNDRLGYTYQKMLAEIEVISYYVIMYRARRGTRAYQQMVMARFNQQGLLERFITDGMKKDNIIQIIE